MLIPGLLTYEEYLRRQHSWDEVQRTTRLYGRFYEGDQALMFPMAWLDAAAARFEKMADASRKAVAIGVDGAQGRDLTYWTVVDSLGIIEQIARQTPNTMDIAGETIKNIAIDAGGGGKQIADRLREQGHQIQTVWFGESPTPAKQPIGARQKRLAKEKRSVYKNRRAEMYDGNHRRLGHCADCPSFENLSLLAATFAWNSGLSQRVGSNRPSLEAD